MPNRTFQGNIKICNQQVVGSNPTAGSPPFPIFDWRFFDFPRGVLDVEALAYDAVGIVRAIVIDGGFKE
jgi:hypothetical protein